MVNTPSYAPSDEKGEKAGETPASTAIEEQQKARTLFTYAEGQAILRKVDIHLIFVLMVAYILKGMDSGAISYVKTMNPKSDRNILKQLHMSSNLYGYTSTVFSVFNIVMEVPSNLLMRFTTPRVHYCRIIILWSVVTCCHAAVTNAAGLFVCRAFLGIFEAGLYPGIIVHLTSFYRPDEIGPRIAFIGALYQFCSIFNAFFTYGFSFVNGARGISGWQWVFITEGLLGFLLVGLIFLFMPNYPDTAKFLTENERAWVIGRLPANSARTTDKRFSKQELWVAVKDPITIAMSVMYMCFQSGLLGYLFWLPTIIASFGISQTATVQLLNIPPAVLYWLGGVFGAYMNERLVMLPRAIVFMIPMLCWSAGLCCLAFVKSKVGLYVIICVFSGFGSWGYQSFYPWRAQTLRGSTHAAYTMALITGASNIPGIYSAQIFRSQYAPRYLVPYMVSLALTLLSGVVAMVVWYLTYDTEKETRRILALRRHVGKAQNLVLEEDVVLSEEIVRRNDIK